jgi:hypothetical protein
MADDIYTTTRRSLHAVAEQVLAAALHAASGKIGLRVAAGGFATPPFPSPHGARSLRVEGVTMVVEDDRGERRAPLETVRAAADLAGITPGAPAEVYHPATPLEPDRPLAIDGAAAHQVAAFFELAGTALAQLRTERQDDDPTIVQLWPEHFDLATTIADVNYGGSPGDDGHARPYLYVGPFRPPSPDGGFWNEPFGSSVPADGLAGVGEALSYFRAGHDRLGRVNPEHDA